MQKYKTREKVVFALTMLVRHHAHHIDNLAAGRWTLNGTSRTKMRMSVLLHCLSRIQHVG